MGNDQSDSIEKAIADIIREGQKADIFIHADPDMSAGIIKAMLQEWYLKRKKYGRRGVGVDQYADFIQQVILSFLQH